jgi:hypothetical protein
MAKMVFRRRHAPLGVVPMWYHNLFEVVLLKTHET